MRRHGGSGRGSTQMPAAQPTILHAAPRTASGTPQSSGDFVTRTDEPTAAEGLKAVLLGAWQFLPMAGTFINPTKPHQTTGETPSVPARPAPSAMRPECSRNSLLECALPAVWDASISAGSDPARNSCSADNSAGPGLACARRERPRHGLLETGATDSSVEIPGGAGRSPSRTHPASRRPFRRLHRCARAGTCSS